MSRITRSLHPAPLAASIPAAPRRGARASLPRRAALLAAVALAIAAAAYLAGNDPASARAAAADPELAWLLRSMALTKACIATAALWLADWRLRHPAGPGLVTSFVAAAAMMAAAPVLMWHVAPAGTGALLFHGGLALLLLLAWIDRSATQDLLAAAVAARRPRPGAAPENAR